MGNSFRDLKAWQKSVDLVTEIYKTTQRFPKEEIYGLSIQLRRASVSVASNIAEGKGRYSDKDFVHFLRQAQGSLFELDTQLTIANRLGYLGEADLSQLEKRTNEIGRMVSGLIESLARHAATKSAA